MGLVAGRECGGKVSTEAMACPHCRVGVPAQETVKQINRSFDTWLYGSAVAVFLFLPMLAVLSANDLQNSPAIGVALTLAGAGGWGFAEWYGAPEAATAAGGSTYRRPPSEEQEGPCRSAQGPRS